MIWVLQFVSLDWKIWKSCAWIQADFVGKNMEVKIWDDKTGKWYLFWSSQKSIVWLRILSPSNRHHLCTCCMLVMLYYFMLQEGGWTWLIIFFSLKVLFFICLVLYYNFCLWSYKVLPASDKNKQECFVLVSLLL